LIAEHAFMELVNRTEDLQLLSAEQRYLKLMEQNPQIIQRVPQYYVASFLGVEPQSLSRIRKKIIS
jgi:CRP/FNR family transcriptional regulator, anaerobic regulatory protein